MNRAIRHIGFLLCLFICITVSFGQRTEGQSANVQTKEITDPAIKIHSPKKAVLLALALPGAGQIYNEKYWKLPIVYGSLAASTYYLIYNHNKFKDFDKALTIRKNGGDDKYENMTDLSLEANTLNYRNERDRAILITAGLYLLQVVDAYVDAHLFNFDISDDLTLDVNPMFNYDLRTESLQPGITLNFSLR